MAQAHILSHKKSGEVQFQSTFKRTMEKKKARVTCSFNSILINVNQTIPNTAKQGFVYEWRHPLVN